jgi:hypothetical protein
MVTTEKFIQALETVKVNGIFSLGLVVNKSSQVVDWSKLITKLVILSLGEKTSVEEILPGISQAFENKKWLVLDCQTDLPAEIYAQLKLLSTVNRLQLLEGEKVIDTKQPPESRVIVVLSKARLEMILTEYPEFKHLFGPVIDI